MPSWASPLLFPATAGVNLGGPRSGRPRPALASSPPEAREDGGPPVVDLLHPRSFRGGQPWEAFRRLRRREPVSFHPESDGPGFWAVTRYEDVRAVGRDPRTFSSVPTIMIRDPDPATTVDLGDHAMMLTMDPPRHTRYRRLVSRAFTPRAAGALAPRARVLATRIVDDVIERGACDFVAEVAGEMPSFVIAELMGIPREDGRRLDDLDFQLFFLLLIDVGGDTTRNLVAAGVHALLQRPEALARLRADLEGGLPAAREELLRFTSPSSACAAPPRATRSSAAAASARATRS